MRFLLVLAAVLGAAIAFATSAEPTPQVPTATEADRALAPLEIARDGRTITIRSIARDELRVCVEPKVGTFGPTPCFQVGQIRRGRVVVR
jgi:hypothetical protein